MCGSFQNTSVIETYSLVIENYDATHEIANYLMHDQLSAVYLNTDSWNAADKNKFNWQKLNIEYLERENKWTI